MKTIIIAGGSGFIGQNLTALLLKNNFRVIILSRNQNKKSDTENLNYCYWDPDNAKIDRDIFGTAHYLINLSGENIGNKKWTEEQKKKILDSRIISSSFLIKCLKEIPNDIKAVISASAIGYYGNGGKKKTLYNEDSPKGEGFLAHVCEEWEKSILPAGDIGKRLVIIRTGVVLDAKVGALKEFLEPFKFRIATILGTGSQYLNWIHVDDICNAYLFAIQSDIKGIFNVNAPQPITYKDAVIALGKTMYGNKFISFKVPVFILKLVKDEMIEEMVLTNSYISSQKLVDKGFQFAFPYFNKECIKNLLHREN